MDGNGNNSSKVSTLRQRFENYDKVEQRKASVVAATIFQQQANQSTLTSTSESTKSLKNSQSIGLSGRQCFSGNPTIDTKVSRSKTSGDIKAFADGLVDKSSLQRSASEKDLLMSVSVAQATAEAPGRRNGIYISNSLRMENEGTSSSSLERDNKRRGIILMDDEIVTVHHRHARGGSMIVDEEGYVVDGDEEEDEDDVDDDGVLGEVDDLDEEDVDDVEHDDDPAVETSIPIAFDRHDEVLGDGSSIASNTSTTSSHHSYHGFSSVTKNRRSILGNHGRNPNNDIITEESKNEKGDVMSSSSANNMVAGGGGGGMRESGSKANTPTSSSSCSSGSGACGKVKRRNAFRHKDVSSFPTSAAAGDGSSSAVMLAAAVAKKTKVVVERVKSLDSATSSNVNNHSSSVGQNHEDILNSAVLLFNSATRKCVSTRDNPNTQKQSMKGSSKSGGGGGGSGVNLVGRAGVSENSKKNESTVSSTAGGISNPPHHELMVANNNNHSSNSNNNSICKGSPAQRAASLRVHVNNNNSSNKSSSSSLRSSSSQIYEPCATSAFARNPASGNNASNQPPQHLQQQHLLANHHPHHQFYPQQNCNNANNQHVGNTPADNLSNNSINHNNNNNNNHGSSQRVVNVVTPYQVTDIYNQLKISDSSSSSCSAFINNGNGNNNNGGNSNNGGKKQAQQLKQMLNEVEYAVPMIQSVQQQPQQQQQRFQSQPPNSKVLQQQQQQQQQHSPQKNPSSEIPPKVPPPPLNYPPSSIRKEQFGLPSPNSSYSFLPHRNPQVQQHQQAMLVSNTKNQSPSAKTANSNVAKREVAAGAAASTSSPASSSKAMKKGVVYGPPEKPPRTFLYNQAPVSSSSSTRQVLDKPQRTNVKQGSATTSTSRNNANTDFYGSTTTNTGKKRQPTQITNANSSQNSSSVNLNSSSSGSSIGVGSSSSSSSGAIGLPTSSLSQAKRQHSSSSSSSTLTSGTAATIVNNYRQQMSPSSSFKNQESTPNSSSKAATTGRQTNNNVITTNNAPITPAAQRKTMDTSDSVYISRSSKKRVENDNGNGTPESSRTSKSASIPHKSQGSHNTSKLHPHHHHHIHPPLVRSKTESQLVVKSKSSANRFLNRPSDGGIGYGMEMMSLEPGGRQHSHYHQDLLVDATHPNATFTHVPLAHNQSTNLYYASTSSNGPPVHHQSQTNLLTLTSNKIYEQQQYRSINNLLRYSNNNTNSSGNNGGAQSYNKYPSNPGLHYASRELSWLDNGLPPVPTMTNAGSNYNLYSGSDNQQNNNTRHASLLYTTNIDISSSTDDRQHHHHSKQHVKTSSARQALTFSDNNSSSPVDLLQQQQNSLYAIKTSDNPSVQQQQQHQLRNSGSHFNNNQNHYVHHPLYQYRLSERSKSEWALNAVHSGGGNASANTTNNNQFSRGLNNSIGGGGGGGNSASFGINSAINSSTSSAHRQLANSNSRLNNVGSGGNNANCDGSNAHNIANRRATVAIAGGNMVGGGGGGSGHPILDSSLPQPPTQNIHQHHHHGSVGKGHRHQQQHQGPPNSIQHLVNQLFSTSTIKEATSSTDSGIQLGSESLSSCDTPIGDSTTDTGDSDCENDGDTSNTAREVVEARKGYVRRVSSVRVQELGESLHRLIQSSKITHNADPLFECLLVVGLDRDPKNGIYHPYIREKFPRDAKLAEGVEEFCFPDSYEWPCHEGSTAQFYTLAITDQRGGRKFGCCFRILPEGANFCIPITYCIISSHRAIGFYREILREVTACHGHSEYQRRHFFQELYKKSFPTPGTSITLTEPTIEETYVQNEHMGYGSLTGSPMKTVTIRRRADHRLDEGDLVTLVSTVDLSIVIKLFGSLLLERKVVLLSRALSTLSLCVEALESLLYPFKWQHTLVPILPLNMPDVIDAPAPFLIGVLRSSRNAWDKTLDDGIVVDLDVENGKIISCVGDEGTILPKRIHRKLRNALSQLVLDLADQKESTKNVLISECFIRMFVETLGHYSNHIVTKPDSTKVFEREGFVKAAESKATQNFLEWFSETSMFNEFIELKLKNSHQHGLFEQRVMEQIESGPIVHGSGGSGTPLKKDLWIKMKGPFGTWLKETFK